MLDCDTFTMTGATSAISAAGYPGTSSYTSGGWGGAVTIKASRLADMGAGVVSAAGAAGYSGTTQSGFGGKGGTVTVRSARLELDGTLVDVSGGDAGDTPDEMAMDGGDAGAATLAGAQYTAGSTVDASGGEGADAGESGGDGGDGGTVSARWCTKSGVETYNVSGGHAGNGDIQDGASGAAGTTSSALGIDAQYDSNPITVNGQITSTEFYRGWWWNHTTSGVSCVSYVVEDGQALYVGVRNNDNTNQVYDLYIDVDGNGSALPDTDDLRLSAFSPVPGTQYEYHGTGVGWQINTVSGGWTASIGTQDMGSGNYDQVVEFRIPFSKLGITAGQARRRASPSESTSRRGSRSYGRVPATGWCPRRGPS